MEVHTRILLRVINGRYYSRGLAMPQQILDLDSTMPMIPFQSLLLVHF